MRLLEISDALEARNHLDHVGDKDQQEYRPNQGHNLAPGPFPGSPFDGSPEIFHDGFKSIVHALRNQVTALAEPVCADGE